MRAERLHIDRFQRYVVNKDLSCLGVRRTMFRGKRGGGGRERREGGRHLRDNIDNASENITAI